jgi:hypothetical protein
MQCMRVCVAGAVRRGAARAHKTTWGRAQRTLMLCSLRSNLLPSGMLCGAFWPLSAARQFSTAWQSVRSCRSPRSHAVMRRR